jgi:hypothetical protein
MTQTTERSVFGEVAEAAAEEFLELIRTSNGDAITFFKQPCITGLGGRAPLRLSTFSKLLPSLLLLQL